jgi:hypothetical protein
VASYASPPCSPCTRLRFSRVSRHSSGKSASVLTRRGRHFLEKRAVAWVSTMGHRGFGASAIVSRRLPNVPFRHPPTAGQSALESGFFGSRRARGRCALARTDYRHLEHTGSLLNRGGVRYYRLPKELVPVVRRVSMSPASDAKFIAHTGGTHLSTLARLVTDHRTPSKTTVFMQPTVGIRCTRTNPERSRTHPNARPAFRPRGPLARCGRSAALWPVSDRATGLRVADFSFSCEHFSPTNEGINECSTVIR